jgi:hypothetical protein
MSNKAPLTIMPHASLAQAAHEERLLRIAFELGVRFVNVKPFVKSLTPTTAKTIAGSIDEGTVRSGQTVNSHKWIFKPTLTRHATLLLTTFDEYKHNGLENFEAIIATLLMYRKLVIQPPPELTMDRAVHMLRTLSTPQQRNGIQLAACKVCRVPHVTHSHVISKNYSCPSCTK